MDFSKLVLPAIVLACDMHRYTLFVWGLSHNFGLDNMVCARKRIYIHLLLSRDSVHYCFSPLYFQRWNQRKYRKLPPKKERKERKEQKTKKRLTLYQCQLFISYFLSERLAFSLLLEIKNWLPRRKSVFFLFHTGDCHGFCLAMTTYSGGRFFQSLQADALLKALQSSPHILILWSWAEDSFLDVRRHP